MGAELRCQAQPQAPLSPGEGPQGCQLLLALFAHASVSCGLWIAAADPAAGGWGERGQHPSTSQMRLCPESFTGRAMITPPASDRAAQVSLLTWLLGDGTAAAISKS